MIYYWEASYYLITKIKVNEDIFLHYDKSTFPNFSRKASLIKNLRIKEVNPKKSYDSGTHPSNVLFLSGNLQRFAGMGSVLLGP